MQRPDTLSVTTLLLVAETLLQLNVQKASWVVLTHAGHELMAGDSHSMRSLQMEHHQMVLRLVTLSCWSADCWDCVSETGMYFEPLATS